MKLYLLPLNEHKVKYSFVEQKLKSYIKETPGLPYEDVLEVEISDELAGILEEDLVLDKPYERFIHKDYYEKVERTLKNPPEWFSKEGLRIYIIFGDDKKCYWSPSGNNLNSFRKRNPEHYITDAIRVELNKESYVKITGYWECMCDNF